MLLWGARLFARPYQQMVVRSLLFVSFRVRHGVMPQIIRETQNRSDDDHQSAHHGALAHPAKRIALFEDAGIGAQG